MNIRYRVDLNEGARAQLTAMLSGGKGALYEAFPAPEAHRVLQRLDIHYTPEHAELAQHGGNRNRCAAGTMSGSQNR